MNALSQQDCLEVATKRREDMNLPYSGALLPSEAYTILSADAKAVLVDVRTVPELLYVGRVHSSVHIEWQVFPDMTINQHFCDLLAQHAAAEVPVLFLCRSGVRSHHAAAAAAEAGYSLSYNILEGFEGDINEHGHRNKVNGWRFSGLPWAQS